MILTINNRLPLLGGRVLTKEKSTDVVLTFDVVGSYFPARNSPLNDSALRISNLNNISNVAYINYNDGTGEHAYNFKASGTSRGFYMETVANTTDPALISATGVYNYPVHFYQDLPVGVKNTVNDTYMLNGQPRTISIRFSNPGAVLAIVFNRVWLYNQLPGALSRLIGLKTLNISGAAFITSFPQFFLNSQITTLTLSNVGPVMENGFPLWVLNSPIINLSLVGSINLSGSATAKRFDEIDRLKESLVSISLENTQINYVLPSEFSLLYKMTNCTLSNNPSTAFRLPNDLSGLTSLAILDLNRTGMPLIEYERIIQSIPSLRTINIKNLSITTDFNFTNTNSYLTTVQIGGSSWNAGAVPSFVNKLLGLKTLDLTQVSGNLSTTTFTSFGNFANCILLEHINCSRITTMPTTIPSWFSVLTKLKTITAPAAYGTLARVNAFVDSLYDFVVANSFITGTSATPFRNMIIHIYGSSTNDMNGSVRPSGTYQQPAGYSPGVSNGSPASQMEKIWVMTFQYSHTWTYKP